VDNVGAALIELSDEEFDELAESRVYAIGNVAGGLQLAHVAAQEVSSREQLGLRRSCRRDGL
jgi:pyruvate/2-oxoglutarate dehydrogenase complex dihydrolipoamide dehydrogenase (E3) component